MLLTSEDVDCEAHVIVGQEHPPDEQGLPGGSVALVGGRSEPTPKRRCSDRAGELGEGGREPMLWIDIHTEFVMAAAQVLHERMSCAALLH